MRLVRLLRASVGPFVTLEMCQLVIWGVQRLMVRPSRLISVGRRGLRGRLRAEGVLESEDQSVDPVDVPDGFGGVPGCAHFAVGVAGVEESTQAGFATVADLLMSGTEEPPYPIQRVSFAASVS